jgi:DNA-binding Lrp family transcriptional regulator
MLNIVAFPSIDGNYFILYTNRGGESMTRAYILIEALPGKAIELTNVVKGLQGVKTVHLVTGPYDVIAFVEAQDLKSLGEMIVKKIQATGCVARTLTCITVEE